MFASNETSTTPSADSGGSERTNHSDSKVEVVFTLTLLSLTLIPVSWSAMKLCLISQSLLNKHRANQQANSNNTASKAIQMRLRQSSSKWSFWLERLYTSVFVMSRSHQAVALLSLSTMLIRIIILAYSRQIRSQSHWRSMYFFSHSFIYWIQGYVFQARLLSTFQRAKTAVPHRNKVKNAFAVVNIFLIVMVVFAFSILFFLEALIILVPVILGTCLIFYIALCLHLIWTFWTATLKVASNVDDDDGMDRSLVDNALRVTVCAAVSIFSNFVTVVNVVLSLFICSYDCFLTWILISVTFVAIDILTNVFALLCSYQEGAQYYYVVFGSLHRCLFEYVTDNH